jgi:transposase
MEHPPAVLEKAQRLEQLLQRVAAGEPLDEMNAELGFDLDEAGLTRQQAKYEAGGRTWKALVDGRYGHPREAHSALREWMYARKEEDESLCASWLVEKIEERFDVKLSVGHVNYLLRKRGLSAPPGRPPKRSPEEQSHGEGKQHSAEEVPDEGSAAAKAATTAETASQSMDNAGLFFPRDSKGRDGGGGGH